MTPPIVWRCFSVKLIIMKLIIGLGNPGEKYKNNRHNVGQIFIGKLQLISHNKNILLKKSGSFMNDSGDFVKSILTKSKLETSNLYIIHDDLDITLGSYKIQFGKGPKIHNGINDIQEKLGTSDFWYVRVGVDNRDPNNRIPGEQYVLEDFTNEERDIIDKVIDEICKKLVIS
ncbi:MAG: aminoacyl-tRNA hydrolase [Candidatus Woesebacteria bacterium]|nr:aminoacyl-tRNA hydrolase [Candidatus Woesebacteria bacterium]